MNYLTIEQIRNQNIQRLVAQKFGGVTKDMAECCEIRPAVLHKSNAKAASAHRGIGHKMVRLIEQRLSLPDGWIDTPEVIPGTRLARLAELNEQQLRLVSERLGLDYTFPLIPFMSASERRRSNVRRLLIRLELSGNELARQSGLALPAFARALSIRSTREFTRSLCDRIEDALELERGWLDYPQFFEGEIGHVAVEGHPSDIASQLDALTA